MRNPGRTRPRTSECGHPHTTTASITRRAFVAGLAGAAVVGATAPLLGCSASNVVVDHTEVADERMQLTFFGNKHEALNVVAIESIIDAYMDKHPDVSVVYESIKGNDYFETLDKRLNSNNGDDVFMVNHDTLVKYGRQGILADLSDLAAAGSFSDLAYSQMSATGTVVYLPTSVSAFGLYCNTELLARWNMEVPQTLDSFMDACDKLKQGGLVPIVANNDISLKTLAIGRGLADVYATGNAAEQMQAFSSDPAGLAAHLRPGLEVAQTLVSAGYVDGPLARTTEKTSDDLEQFATGSYPFMLTGAWASVRVHDMAPNLAFEVHPLPVLDDKSVLVVNVDTRISVNASSQHIDEAKGLAGFFAQPWAVELFADSQCSFSPLTDSAAPSDKALAPLAEAFKAGGAVIGSDDNLSLPIWDATRRCAEVLLEGASAAEAEHLLATLLAEAANGDAA